MTLRRLLRRGGNGHTIPERSDQRARRRGRPPTFERNGIGERNVIEAVYEPVQAVASGRDLPRQRAANCHAALLIVALVLWLGR
jgi:hypothetical protein